jgi:uncharacterized protein
LPLMNDWFSSLNEMGVASVRLHVLEIEGVAIQQKYALSAQENIDALLNFARLESSLSGMRFDIFSDIERLLLAQDERVTCVWRACDPYTTVAVQGVEGYGQRSNCGRTNKDGIDVPKADAPGYERYIALYHTPQEYGGCRDCRFFLQCKGQCPGTALESDWRNRTEHCEVWKTLFRTVEERLLERGAFPLSALPERKTVEAVMLHEWAAARNPSLQSALAGVRAARKEQD